MPAQLPGLVLRMPVGLEIDGPLGSDGQLLALGLGIEGVLGSAPSPRL